MGKVAKDTKIKRITNFLILERYNLQHGDALYIHTDISAAQITLYGASLVLAGTLLLRVRKILIQLRSLNTWQPAI